MSGNERLLRGESPFSASRPLRVLFVPFGSEGDVNPLLWLAEGMAGRGHLPTFMITPHYGRLADRRGFSWLPVGTEEEFVRFARDPRLWQKTRGPQTVIQGMTVTLPAYREAFAKTDGRFDLVVLSSLALGAASVAEAFRIPRLTMHLQPALFRSTHECPVFLEELSWLAGSPRWVKHVFFKIVDGLLWEGPRKSLNRFRSAINLVPLRDFYLDGFHGAEGVAALFPDWFARPQPDWPGKVRQFGFPLDNSIPKRLSEPLEAFLEAGDRPVVWTHGSANFDIRRFQQAALATSRELNLRCLLVSLEPPAGSCPEWAFHLTHAPFQDLFSRSRAVVHHGGIGTTAQCIAAGVPQFIVPRSHDQPDNASRIVKLGLGKSLPYRKIDHADLRTGLAELLSSTTIASHCAEFQKRVAGEKTLEHLCTWAEELAEQKLSLPVASKR
jgi:rhamnosyltransferase subunit B